MSAAKVSRTARLKPASPPVSMGAGAAFAEFSLARSPSYLLCKDSTSSRASFKSLSSLAVAASISARSRSHVSPSCLCLPRSCASNCFTLDSRSRASSSTTESRPSCSAKDSLNLADLTASAEAFARCTSSSAFKASISALSFSARFIAICVSFIDDIFSSIAVASRSAAASARDSASARRKADALSVAVHASAFSVACSCNASICRSNGRVLSGILLSNSS